MNVAVCVPFRARNDHESRVWDWCSRWWYHHFPGWLMTCHDDGNREPFNRSAARNAAWAWAQHDWTETYGTAIDVIVFANADTVTLDPADLATAVAIAAADGWCLPALYVETSAEYTAATLAEPVDIPMIDPLSSYDRQLSNAIAGPQVMSREWFEDVGRWDEAFTSWGWEDKALRDALSTLHAPPTYVGTAVHLWHPRGRAEWPQSNQHNRERWARLYDRAARQGPEAMRAVIDGR